MAGVDHAALYRAVRRRVTGLVRDLPGAALDAEVPATPGWTVRDIVAHLAGTTADIVAGNLDGIASDAWTQAQVDARRDTPLADVLAEWARCAGAVEPRMAGFPGLQRAMLLTDAVTHEHDVRGALGRPGARDTAAVVHTFRGVIAGLGTQLGAGTLRIVHDAGETVVGTGGPVASVAASRFEVVRAAVGRRSLGQIGGWPWDGAAHPEVLVLDRFRPPRATPLVE